MNSSRIAFIAAIAAVASWSVKAVAIGTAGGLDKSPVEGPLFFAGLLSFVVATVALGIAATRGRPAWVRAAAGVIVAPVVSIGIFLLGVGALVAALQPADPGRHWVWAEVGLWVSALSTLALVLGVRRLDPGLVRGPASGQGTVPGPEGFGKARLAG